jgi:hypothetical protein
MVPLNVSDVFAYGALSTASSLQSRDVLHAKKNALYDMTVQSLQDPHNNDELMKMLARHGIKAEDYDPATNKTQVVDGFVGAIRNLQIAYQLEPNEHSTFTDSLLVPLKESTSSLVSSQAEFLKVVLTEGDDKVLSPLHEQLKSTYGTVFDNVETLRNIQRSSQALSILYDNSGVGAIKFVTKNAGLLTGTLQVETIQKLTSFYDANFFQNEQNEAEIVTTRSEIETLKESIAKYSNQWTNTGKTENEENEQRLHQLGKRLKRLEYEVESWSPSSVTTDFSNLIGSISFGNSKLMEFHDVPVTHQRRVNFNLLFMSICSHDASELNQFVRSVGDTGTQLGALFSNLFPTDPSVHVALTGDYSHTFSAFGSCLNTFKTKGATQPYSETQCLHESVQTVGATLGRARGLTPFIATIGELAKTIDTFTSAKIEVLSNNRSTAYDKWHNIIKGEISGFSGNTYDKIPPLRVTHLVTLDTMLSRTMLDTLKRTQHANFKNIMTYMSSLVSFPANTPGCMAANFYASKHGTASPSRPFTASLDKSNLPTWFMFLQENLGVGYEALHASQNVLAKLSDSCLAFVTDTRRIEVFSEVVVDCVQYGTQARCSKNLLKYTRDARGANAALGMVNSLTRNLHALPKEATWLWSQFEALGGLFGSIGLLMGGSLPMMIIAAIIGVLLLLKYKFGFIFSLIFGMIRGVLGLGRRVVGLGRFATRPLAWGYRKLFRRPAAAAAAAAAVAAAADPAAAAAADGNFLARSYRKLSGLFRPAAATAAPHGAAVAQADAAQVAASPRAAQAAAEAAAAEAAAAQAAAPRIPSPQAVNAAADQVAVAAPHRIPSPQAVNAAADQVAVAAPHRIPSPQAAVNAAADQVAAQAAAEAAAEAAAAQAAVNVAQVAASPQAAVNAAADQVAVAAPHDASPRASPRAASPQAAVNAAAAQAQHIQSLRNPEDARAVSNFKPGVNAFVSDIVSSVRGRFGGSRKRGAKKNTKMRKTKRAVRKIK